MIKPNFFTFFEHSLGIDYPLPLSFKAVGVRTPIFVKSSWIKDKAWSALMLRSSAFGHLLVVGWCKSTPSCRWSNVRARRGRFQQGDPSQRCVSVYTWWPRGWFSRMLANTLWFTFNIGRKYLNTGIPQFPRFVFPQFSIFPLFIVLSYFPPL